MNCPFCQKETATHKDGSFVLHSRSDGGLCEGTNCIRYKTDAIVIGGTEIPVNATWLDPDGTLVSTVDRSVVIKKIEKRCCRRRRYE